eukprot:673099-Prymnesium_polylepis.1
MCFTIASAFSYFKPYADAADTRLASLCQAQIFFSLLSSVLNTFEQSTLRLNHNVDILLVVLTLLPIGLAVYAESPLASYVGRQSVGRASPKVGPPTCKPPPLSGLAGSDPGPGDREGGVVAGCQSAAVVGGVQGAVSIAIIVVLTDADLQYMTPM